MPDQMTEYYIETNSFAAPFFSDQGHEYVEASSAKAALDKVAASYGHPAGLYAAVAYTSADARNKGEKPLARWLCNHEREKQARTANLGGYSFRSLEPGRFEINGELFTVKDPKEGRCDA